MKDTSGTTIETSRVHRLAKRLQEDIRRRGLGTGDRYLTATETARMLGVSTTTAHRALKVLADSEVLLRRRNRGTFIGDKVRSEKQSTQVKNLHVLIPAELDPQTVPVDAIFKGIYAEMPEASIQFHHLPQENPVDFVQQVISSTQSTTDLLGVIPISSPREVYRFLAKSGVPTVIYGCPYPGDPPLPSVEIDNYEAGRLLTEYVVGKGHKRIAVLLASQGRPGDNDFFDGVAEALTQAGLPANALAVRLVHDEHKAFYDTTRQLLQSDACPTALITRDLVRARIVSEAVAEFEGDSHKKIEVAFHGETTGLKNPSPYAHVQTRHSLEEIIASIVRMLKQCRGGQPVESETIKIPVELRRENS